MVVVVMVVAQNSTGCPSSGTDQKRFTSNAAD